MKELKSKIEALLYCVPDGLTAEKISELIKVKDIDEIKAALYKLQEEHDARSSSLKIIRDVDLWKFDITGEHSEMIKKAAEPELDNRLEREVCTAEE